MPRPPAAAGSFRRGAEAWTTLAGLVLLSSLFAAAPANADDASAPGAALHPPRSGALPERVRSATPAGVNTEGLYSYMTPFAEPRWLRLQQEGDVVWGTIDVNGPFGMCDRTGLSGWVSGDTVTFDVDLAPTDCPCSGPQAALRFIGTVDGEGGIAGTWTNNCTPPTGVWWACRSADPPQNGVCDPLPENEPPYPVALVPAAGAVAFGALAVVLAGCALVGMRRRRVAAVD